ncbi:MAG: VWA domain-containing protein [Phycisphaera sp.]|nr:MAG: VWA domain-containing protein [Phycisphaera sp.]
MSRRRASSSTPLGLVVNGDVWALLALLFMSLFTSMVPLVTLSSTADAEELEAELATTLASLQSAIGVASDAEDARQAAVSEAEAWQGKAQQASELAKQQRDRAEQAKALARREEKRADVAEALASSESSRADRAENELATKSVDVVFLIDTSQSQAARIAQLVDRVRTLSETLGPLTTLRVGVIAYRMDQRVFRLIQIRPTSVDQGKSLNQLAAFLGAIDTKSSATDLAAAVEAGIAMLDSSSNQLASKRLVTLTDVGPFEAGDRSAAAASRVQAHLAEWVKSDDRNGTVHIFTGTHGRDRAFFQGVSRQGGSRATFSENPSDMLEPLLRGITSR